VNRRLRNFALVPACLALLTSCDGNRVAGGTTETDNMVAARIIRVDSLLPDWNHPGQVPTVGTLRLDSTNMDFTMSTPDGGDLAVETLDSVALPFRIVYWDKSARLGRIQVRLDPWLQRPGSRFLLRWGLKDSTRTDSTGVWSGIPAGELLALTSVLVDDFEGSSLRSLLPDSGTWISVAADTASVEPPDLEAAGAGRAGQALHISYTAPVAKGYVYVGLPLGKGPCNLHSLDSIVLWARGAQTILNVSFDHQGTVNTKAWASLSLDSTWKRISLRPADLDPSNGIGGNVGWAGVEDSVTNLSLFAARGTDMWIDDVRLYGIDRDDLP
jgi:hypothetical protein